MINRRVASKSPCLTEKQKEKLRKRQIIPLFCDEFSNTQSNSCTVDTPTLENIMLKHQVENSNYENKQITTSLSFFKAPTIDSIPETNPTIESSPMKPDEIEKNDENVPEESSMSKKLRRSCRPSISARKSLADRAKRKRLMPSTTEVTVSTPTNPSNVTDTTIEQVKKPPIKSILKRLSPTKPRQDHTRRVVFHDQVKVLVFASPARRDLLAQQRKRSPSKDDMKSPTRIIL